MLHTFEDWFCSAKLLDFPFFCYCTFLYRLISVVSYFYLYFSYLRKRKTLPHGTDETGTVKTTCSVRRCRGRCKL